MEHKKTTKEATVELIDVMIQNADKGPSGFWTDDYEGCGNPKIFPEFEEGLKHGKSVSKEHYLCPWNTAILYGSKHGNIQTGCYHSCSIKDARYLSKELLVKVLRSFKKRVMNGNLDNLENITPLLMKSDIEFIQNKMKSNREMIEKLRAQLNESTIKGNELKQTLENTIVSFQKQIAEKDRQLSELKSTIEAKDVHISQLDQKIDNLHNDVTDLQTESSQKSKTISEQDKQLNTAYYVFGTKSELKEQHILEKNEVLRQNFNKNYFTKIDIRNERSIPLYSKSVKVLTHHPSNSYRLEADASKQYTLRIVDPNQFWSTSKYLVVLVK